jgi:hypothetical protein
MLEIKKSIEQGFSGQPGGLYDILTQLQNIGASNKGEVFFVEANAGSDGYDGRSWDKAFKSLPYALAVSDASISRGAKGWESRNTVFCRGQFTETLVELADKTDIIGIGGVNTRTRLTGTHIPADNTYSTRFFNFEFRDDGASSGWTFAAGAFEFHNCLFKHTNSSETYAITITNPTDVLIEGCEFIPYIEVMYSAAAIYLIADGSYQNCRIINNIIRGAKGIYCTDNALNNHFSCLIKDNFIQATTQCIDDNTDDWDIVNNRMVTATTMANGLDINAKKAVGNIITGSDGSRLVPSTDQEY